MHKNIEHSLIMSVLGQSATFAIRPLNRKIILKRSWFRKGMVLIDSLPVPQNLPGGKIAAEIAATPRATRYFDISLYLFQGPHVCFG